MQRGALREIDDEGGGPYDSATAFRKFEFDVECEEGIAKV